MANVDGRFGLRPLKSLSGGGHPAKLSRYDIASAYDTNIFKGDPVELTDTSKQIAQAAAANADNIGVFMGVDWVASDGEPKFGRYWPADTVTKGSVAARALVCDDPNVIFTMQCESDTDFTLAMIGNGCDWVFTHAGDTATGLSGAEADISALATTGKALRIMGLHNDPDNAVGEHAVIEVMFAEHVLGRVVSGVGGI